MEKAGLGPMQIKAKIKARLTLITRQQKAIAQEFVRQFAKWLRRKRIDPNAVIDCNEKGGFYHLSYGWKEKRMVVGDSGVRALAIGEDIDKIGANDGHPDMGNEKSDSCDPDGDDDGSHTSSSNKNDAESREPEVATGEPRVSNS